MPQKLTLDYQSNVPKERWRRRFVGWLRSPRGEDSFLASSALHFAIVGWVCAILGLISGFHFSNWLALPCVMVAGVMGFTALLERETKKEFQVAAIVLAGIYAGIILVIRAV